MLPLEDLYGINDSELDVQNMEDKLKETLRIVEEKEQVITQLRRSWQDLALKYADAENTIDALRFGDASSLLSRPALVHHTTVATSSAKSHKQHGATSMLSHTSSAKKGANNPIPNVTVDDISQHQECISTHWLEKVKKNQSHRKNGTANQMGSGNKLLHPKMLKIHFPTKINLPN